MPETQERDRQRQRDTLWMLKDSTHFSVGVSPELLQNCQDLGIVKRKTHRERKAGQRKQHQINVVVSPRLPTLPSQRQSARNSANLISVPVVKLS